MNLKKTIALVVACLLAGVLTGYLFWGLPSGRLSSELAAVKARLAEEALRREERRTQIEATRKELETERARRAELELLISEGRK